MKSLSTLALLCGLSPIIFAQEIPGEYIVELAPGAPVPGFLRAHGIQATYTYDAAVSGFAATLNQGQLNALEHHKSVVSIVPNRVVELDSDAQAGGVVTALVTAAQIIPAGVTRIGAAPGAFAATGLGVGVAIVDTGLDLGNLDLNISPLSHSSFPGIAQDGHGHGTHVGGIVAAKNNDIDVVGVASRATLYAVKVLDDSGSGSDAAIIAGLNWVANNANANPPIKVVNMSLGRRGAVNDNPTMRTAIQNLYKKGITVVVAAGNTCSLEAIQQVPACYPEVLTIASAAAQSGTSVTGYPTLQQDMASFFTSDGAYKNYKVQGKNYTMGVTVSAPGETREDVVAGGYIQSLGIESLAVGGGTILMSGTSMASPHAAGVAALLHEKFPGITPESIRARFRSSAQAKGVAPLNCPTTCYSFDGEREGVLNAPGALN